MFCVWCENDAFSAKRFLLVMSLVSIVQENEKGVESTDVKHLVSRKNYSPFQNLNSKGEYIVARIDDIYNYCRKVRNSEYCFCLPCCESFT